MATKAKSAATDTIEVATKKTTTKTESKTKAVETTAAPKVASKQKKVTHEMIRQRAYEIYLKTGNSNEHDNWVQAEKELLN